MSPNDKSRSVLTLAKISRKAPRKQGRRKERAGEHIIADQSLVPVQHFIANAGFTSEVVSKDYGDDLTVNTFDRDGLIEGWLDPDSTEGVRTPQVACRWDALLPLTRT